MCPKVKEINQRTSIITLDEHDEFFFLKRVNFRGAGRQIAVVCRRRDLFCAKITLQNAHFTFILFI